jgi:PAS domain S-box-containing protein
MFRHTKNRFTFILYLIFALHANQLKAQYLLNFEHIDANAKLSHNSSHCITKDLDGFIWIGTEDGLNRYDGYNMQIYKQTGFSNNEISDIYITSLFVSTDSLIWIGTINGGLNVFDPKTNSFFCYYKNDTSASISDNYIRCFEEDNLGNIWVGTNKGGLNVLNRKTGKFSHYNKSNAKLPDNDVRAIYKSPEGTFFVGTNEGGLGIYNASLDSFEIFNMLNSGLSSNEVTAVLSISPNELYIGTRDGLNIFNLQEKKSAIVESLGGERIQNIGVSRLKNDDFGQLWIGTINGLLVYQKQANRLLRIKHNANAPESLSHNNITDLFIDNHQIVWITTSEGGVNKFDPYSQKFLHIQHIPGDNNWLASNSIRALHAPDSQYIFIGTLGEGLDIFDRKKSVFYHLKSENTKPKSLSGNKVSAILLDTKNRLWIGTWENGLNKIRLNSQFEIESNTIYIPDEQKPKAIGSKAIQFVFEDRKHRIWIGTENGLELYNEKNDDFVHLIHNENDSNSIIANNLQSKAIAEDQQGNIWIGTWNGLSQMTVTQNTNGELKFRFLNFKNNPNNHNSLSDNRIISLYIDKDGTIWAGTYGGGLNKITITRNSNRTLSYHFKRFTKREGLPNEVIYGILEDSNAHLWLSTNDGLAHFDKQTEKITLYSVSDGLQSNQFFWGAAAKSPDGLLIFGGIKGLNWFYPQEINQNPFKPEIKITDIKLFNQSIQNQLKNKNVLELNYQQNMISFEFSALHYSFPMENLYEYKLEGFDKEWITTSADRRYATYTNLDPGSYRFLVRAANCDGLWNENPNEIKLIVKPPVWRTIWFQFLLFILILVLASFIWQRRIRRIRQKNEDLARLVKERTKELELANADLAKLSIVAEKTDSAVIIMDRNGRIEWVNRGFERIYGFNINEIKDENTFNINFDKATLLNHIAKAIATKKSVLFETETINKSQELIYSQVNLTPVFLENKELYKIISLHTDITQIKNAHTQIELQRDELKQKNDEIQFINRQIKGSIETAKYIQTSILPTFRSIEGKFDYFILWKPKDIVSGDFYWSRKIIINKQCYNFLAVVDCTGHGVPGAFVSLISYQLLEQTVVEHRIYEPNLILEHLNNSFIELLHQKDNLSEDGMDLVLCRIIESTDSGSFEVLFAGAKRPLYQYSSQSNKLIKWEAARKSIGGKRTIKNQTAYTQSLFKAHKNDVLYLSSDGYTDQNNAERKRFGSSKFEEILKNIATLPMENQKQMLNAKMEAFMQNEQQRDDITILGIKL